MKRGFLKVELWAVAVVAGVLSLAAVVVLHLTQRSPGGARVAEISAKVSAPESQAVLDGGKSPPSPVADSSPRSLSRMRSALAAPARSAGPTLSPVRADGLIRFPDPEKVGPYADRPTPNMALFGEPVRAKVTVGDRSFELLPNQGGDFQTVYVGRSARAEVDVVYPGAGAGAPVFVEALDGGEFYNGAQALRLVAGAGGRVGFAFRLDDEAGEHQVLLRLGDDEKVLHFWVGAPLAVRTGRSGP